MSSEIIWKVVSTLGRNIFSQADLNDEAFNVSANTGFFRQFSVPLKYAYVPLVLRPATVYYNYIQHCAQRSGLVLAEKKLPYNVNVPAVTSARLTMNFRLYPPSILATTVRLRSLHNDVTKAPFESLFGLRRPRSLPIIRDLIHWSVDLIGQRQNSDPAIPFTETYFGLHFSDVTPDYWGNGRTRLVGLLIGNRDYDEMDTVIVDQVTAKSAELNKKSAHEHLMVNKQGALSFTARRTNSWSDKDRLSRAMDLAEIAMVYQAFLDNVYPESRTDQLEDVLDYGFTRIRAWIERPEAILNVSYTNTLHWRMLVTEFGLQQKLDLLQSENQWLSSKLVAKSERFARIGNNWWNNNEFIPRSP